MKIQNTKEDFSRPIELSGNAQPAEIFPVMDYVFKILAQWKLILLSVTVALILAFLHLRYRTIPIYNVYSSIILKDGKNESPSQINIFGGLDVMGSDNVANEIAILKSTKIITGVINELDLHTSYIVKGRVLAFDLYTDSPIKVKMAQEDINRIKGSIEFNIKINSDNSVSISKFDFDNTNSNANTIHYRQLPAIYPTPYGNVLVNFREGKNKNFSDPIKVVIRHPSSVVSQFKYSLNIKPITENSTLLNLNITNPDQKKGVDFLNALVVVYNRDAIEQKNKEALASKLFIDDRIELIDKELGLAEKKVEDFKKSQGITDLESDTRVSLQKRSVYEEKMLQIETQINLIKFLDDFFKDPKNSDNLIPSNVGINDLALETYINEYNKCLMDRERFRRSNNESNPLIKKINEQINDLRTSISVSISNVLERNNIARNDAQKQLNLYDRKVGTAPTLEREYSEILRNQQIKASLFLMLLQKREEAALKLALSVNSAKVVEDATPGGAITANQKQTYLMAFAVGAAIPILIIILLELLQFKIRNSSELKKLTKIPILGEIPISETGVVAVKENRNNNSDEAFRIMRTNLLFTLGKDKNVILVTSSGTGEGKTFMTINSAISMSLLPNKKVIILGLDLRIPMLEKYLEIDTTSGISEYLSEIETDLKKLIKPSGILPNLFVLPAGTIPPNPTELLAKDTLDNAIAQLKQEFDYIFIDSSPTSKVSDTIVCSRVADATMYVCRSRVTFKSSLKFVNEFTDKKKLNNVSLVVNAVKNYSSGYGISFGYGYGYGNKVNKKGKFSKFYSLIKS